MSTNDIQYLENEIQKANGNLQILNELKEVVTPIAAKAEGHGPAQSCLIYIRDSVTTTKESIQRMEEEVQYLRNLSTNKRIEVMFFCAGHRRFDSDEITEMLQNIRKFKDMPIEKHISFGQSDEVKMFVSEDVDDKEAKMMWENFCRNRFDEQDREALLDGDLLTWNGTEFIESNNTASSTNE